MAKHALLSDIHANLEALVAVYRDFARIDGLRSVVSLGDLVGYGPNPTEVVTGLNSLAKKGYTVRYCLGNHDGAALGRFEFVDVRDPRDLERLANEAGLRSLEAITRQYRDVQRRKFIPVSLNAKVSVLWTRERLAEPYRQFLLAQSQEHCVLGDGVICIHGSPRDPYFDYVMSVRRARRAMEAPLMAGVVLCFVGHTHIPGAWQLPADQVVSFAGNTVVMHDPRIIPLAGIKLDLDATVTMINIGSVGQPRDGDPRAAYAVYDDVEQTVELRRVAYDIAATQQKILAAGLPKSLAERLAGSRGEKTVVEESAAEEDSGQ